jgi:hypothetical protein
MSRAIVGVPMVLLMAYGFDQVFNDGRSTDPVLLFLADVAHGLFGL